MKEFEKFKAQENKKSIEETLFKYEGFYCVFGICIVLVAIIALTLCAISNFVTKAEASSDPIVIHTMDGAERIFKNRADDSYILPTGERISGMEVDALSENEYLFKEDFSLQKKEDDTFFMENEFE